VGGATVNVSAANLNAVALFDQIVNWGGSIVLGASVTLNLTGDLTTQGDASFQILNYDDGSGSGPGTIVGDTTVNVSAVNFSSAGFLYDAIDNSNDGSIA